MSLGGKLTGVNLFECSDEELDMFLGYAEEYNNYIAEKTGVGKKKYDKNNETRRTKHIRMIEEGKKEFLDPKNKK